MKAHLIDIHLVPRSRSSAKVKVKYQGHVSQKMGVVFHYTSCLPHKIDLKCNSSPDKKIPLFYIIQTVFYIIQYTQSHGANICSFGVIKLQNPNLHLSSYTPPLSQPFNP